MRKKNISVKIIALFLVISVVISPLTVFAYNQQEGSASANETEILSQASNEQPSEEISSQQSVSEEESKNTVTEETPAESNSSIEDSVSKEIITENEATSKNEVTNETAAENNKVTGETAAGNKAADEAAADNKTAGETSADNKAAGEAAAEDKVTNETAAEDKAADETAAEDKAADETAADNKVTDKTTTDNKVTNETVSDNTINSSTEDEKTAVDTESVSDNSLENSVSANTVSSNTLKTVQTFRNEKISASSVPNLPTIKQYVMNTTGQVNENDIFAIAYNTGSECRLLYCNSTKTDVWGMKMSNNKLDTSSMLNENLWTVESAGDGNWYLKSMYTSKTYYLDLTRSTNDKLNTVETKTDDIKIKIESTADNKFKISSAKPSGGFNLSYTNKYMASTTETELNLFKLEEVPITKIADYNPPEGTTQGQPYISDTTATSLSFRIPCIVTLSNGRIVTAADIRWNHDLDGRAIDLIVSYSDDNGQTWNYNSPMYFNDSIDPQPSRKDRGFTHVTDADPAYDNAATIMDPVIIADKNDKLYILADLFPGGVAIEGAVPMDPEPATGYADINGNRRLVLYESPEASKQDDNNYTHYVGDYVDGFAPVYDKNNNAITHYIDEEFYLYDTQKQNMYCVQIQANDTAVRQNIFFYNADLHVRCATYLVLLTSVDKGETWSKPVLINDQVSNNNKFYGVGPGTGLALEDDTLIFPMYRHTNSSADERSSLIYSTDGGKTWTRTGDSTRSERCSESVLVKITDDRIRQFIRSGAADNTSIGTLQYVDFTRNQDGEWVTDQKVTAVNGVQVKTNNQLSAILFSKTVQGGKPVIVLSSASGTTFNNRNYNDARADGRIYSFAINNDTDYSMTLLNSFDVWPPGGGASTYPHNVDYDAVGGKECYTYSSIAEQKNGTFGLLVETDFRPARITYRNLSFSEVFGNSVTFDADIEITGDLSKTYNGQPVSPTENDVNKQGRTGAVSFEYYTNETCTQESKLAAAPSNAGEYWVKATVEGTGIIQSNTSAAKKFTISPAPLTITAATAAAKVYDGTTRAAISEVTFDGIQNNETLKLGTDYTVTSAEYNNANVQYAEKINLTVNLTSANYTIADSSFEQKASIAKAPLSIKDITIAPKSADGTKTAVITAVNYEGLLNNDTLILNTDFTITGEFNTAEASTANKVLATVVLSNTVKANNYELKTGTHEQAASITEKMAVGANPATLTGGGKVTITIVNIPNGETVAVNCSDTAISLNGSKNTWTAELPDKTAEYTFTAKAGNQEASCKVSVTAAPIQPQIKIPKIEPDASGQYPAAEKDVQDTTKKVYKLVVQAVNAVDKANVDKTMAENTQVKEAFSSRKSSFMDISLKDTVTRQDVQPAGSITFVLGYPAGTTMDNEFTILHMVKGITPELLTEGTDYVKKTDGIYVTVTSFSPFVIGWKETASTPSTPGQGGGTAAPGQGGSTAPAAPNQGSGTSAPGQGSTTATTTPGQGSTTATTTPGQGSTTATTTPSQGSTTTTTINTSAPVTANVINTAPTAGGVTAPSPKTGDNTPAALVFITLVGCMGVFGYYAYGQKRQKKFDGEK